MSLLRGFGLGASLIVAIGAQNAFVLRQGLTRRHVLPVVLVCTLCDMALIALGAGGFGTLIAHNPLLTRLAAGGGTLFLLFYSLRSFRSAWRPGQTLETDSAEEPAALSRVLLSVLAFSLLNPHVYLDTVVLLGSLAAQETPHSRLYFAGGAMLASGIWFFGLGYGAGRLAPLFRNPNAWRVLDSAIGVIMAAIALSLLRLLG